MSARDDEYVTVAEAATLLRVSPATVRRWIREGDVPAYRLGQRRVALRRTEVSTLITPIRPKMEGARRIAGEERPAGRRLTPEEQQRGFEALARIKKLSDEIMAERGGELFSPSWEILDELRDERTRELG